MTGLKHIDVTAYDDTELGAEVRRAHAEGVRTVVLLPLKPDVRDPKPEKP